MTDCKSLMIVEKFFGTYTIICNDMIVLMYLINNIILSNKNNVNYLLYIKLYVYRLSRNIFVVYRICKSLVRNIYITNIWRPGINVIQQVGHRIKYSMILTIEITLEFDSSVPRVDYGILKIKSNKMISKFIFSVYRYK